MANHNFKRNKDGVYTYNGISVIFTKIGSFLYANIDNENGRLVGLTNKPLPNGINKTLEIIQNFCDNVFTGFALVDGTEDIEFNRNLTRLWKNFGYNEIYKKY